jgi:hypothetical protein
MALWTFALFAVTEPIMGHVVEPMVYGHSTGLSPFAVIIAAIFWTWLWGRSDFFSPRRSRSCSSCSDAMSSGWSFSTSSSETGRRLTPVESFYQRMLAGMPTRRSDMPNSC